MKTAKEIINKVTSNGMRELTEERAEQAMKEYAKEAIKEVVIKYHNDIFNKISTGGKFKTIDEIALEVINNLK